MDFYTLFGFIIALWGKTDNNGDIYEKDNSNKMLEKVVESWLNPKSYVKSYRRKDGTNVKGYYRRRKNK